MSSSHIRILVVQGLMLGLLLSPVKAELPSCMTVDSLCGPKSLLAICNHFRVETNVDELSRLSSYDAVQGTTLLGLQTAARAMGLRAVGMKISADELAGLKTPAIAYLWGSHYVVMEPDTTGPKVTDYSEEGSLVPIDVFKPAYSGFALLIAKNESLFPVSRSNGPDLRFDSYAFDFGFINQGEQAGRTFICENKGDAELVLSKVETSCSCTKAFLPQEQRIPPGGKGRLVLGFDGTGRSGRQLQAVAVYSNDPVSPIVRLEVRGVVRPEHVQLTACRLYFGGITKKNGGSQEITILDTGDGSLAVDNVVSDSDFVKADLRHVTDPALGYVLRVEVKPGAPLGKLKSKIKVSTNHRLDRVVEIPVEADVVGDIKVFADQFFFGVLKKGQNASKTVTLTTTADKPLTIEKIDNPCEYVIVKATPEVPGKSYKITATLKGTAPLGLTKQVVVIHTNDEDQPRIEIPLYALIEE